jgi:hypothetical protein
MQECPSCGGHEISFGSTPFRHFLRSILGTSRRYCAGCGNKWRVHGEIALPCLIVRTAMWVTLAIFAVRSIHVYIRSQAVASSSADRRNGNLSGDRDPLWPGGVVGGPGLPAGFRSESSEDDGFFGGFMSDFRDMKNLLKLAFGSAYYRSGKIPSSDQLTQQQKRDLWNKYGRYFSSKDQAKKSYDDYYSKHQGGPKGR